MRRPVLPLVALIIIVVGCSNSDDSTPVACLEGAQPYLEALEDAPGEVMLDDETPISDCLVENQAGGELAEVGATMLAAATKLNAVARGAPGGPANLQLGYLLGAAQRGAAESDGIHAELVRRLSAAARYSPDNRPLPAVFRRAYRRGYQAGLTDG